jgi:hypothetical protein
MEGAVSRYGRRCTNPNWLEEAEVPSWQRPTFPWWFGKHGWDDSVFLEINFRQRDAACLLLMSSGAGSVVLWMLTEGVARIPSDPELSSDRPVPVHDRSLVYVRWSNEDALVHWTAQCIASLWIPWSRFVVGSSSACFGLCGVLLL